VCSLIRRFSAEILAEATTRGSCVARFLGVIDAATAGGAEAGIRRLDVLKSFGAALAEDFIVYLGKPPVTELEPALFYCMSADPMYEVAGRGWLRAHPAEVMSFQAAHADNLDVLVLDELAAVDDIAVRRPS
jgi:hypothetical protein